MYLSTQEFIYLTLAIALGAIFTRFLPFIVFCWKKRSTQISKVFRQNPNTGNDGLFSSILFA